MSVLVIKPVRDELALNHPNSQRVQRVRPGITVLDEDTPFGPWDLTDAGLERVIAECEHRIDLGAREPGQHAYEIRCARAEQGIRAALALVYRAKPDGTHSYDEHARLGRPPSYWLAMQIDWAKHLRDEPHVLIRRNDPCSHPESAS